MIETLTGCAENAATPLISPAPVVTVCYLSHFACASTKYSERLKFGIQNIIKCNKNPNVDAINDYLAHLEQLAASILGRSRLHHSLAMSLTHHWRDLRWLARKPPKRPLIRVDEVALALV